MLYGRLQSVYDQPKADRRCWEDASRTSAETHDTHDKDTDAEHDFPICASVFLLPISDPVDTSLLPAPPSQGYMLRLSSVQQSEFFPSPLAVWSGREVCVCESVRVRRPDSQQNSQSFGHSSNKSCSCDHTLSLTQCRVCGVCENHMENIFR